MYMTHFSRSEAREEKAFFLSPLLSRRNSLGSYEKWWNELGLTLKKRKLRMQVG